MNFGKDGGSKESSSFSQPHTSKGSIYTKTDFPLHYCAKFGDSAELEKLFVPENLHNDTYDRSPLHWAALTDNTDDGHQCTKRLLKLLEVQNESFDEVVSSRGTEDRRSEVDSKSPDDLVNSGKIDSLTLPQRELLREFVNRKDQNGETALHLAARNEAPLIVEELLLVSADHSIRSKRGEEALRLIYLHTPEAIIGLLNRSITFARDENPEINNRKYSIDLAPIVGNHKAINFDELDGKEMMKDEMELHKETEFLHFINMQELSCREEILAHPLVQYFLQLKWHKMRIFFYLSVFFHFLWLSFFSWFTLDVYYGCCREKVLSGTNLACWDYPFYEDEDEERFSLDIDSPGAKARGAVMGCVAGKDTLFRPFVLLIFVIKFTIKEIFQMMRLKKTYLKLDNLVQWLFVFSLLLILYPKESVYGIQYQIASFGFLFASSVLLDVLNKFNQYGIYVRVLVKVLKRFMESIPLFFVVITTFAVSLHMLFPEHNPPIESFRDALLKVFMMMAGQVRYSGMYQESIDEHYPVSGFIMFMIFYIVIVLLFFRILLGFIISDTKKLQEEAEVNNIATCLEQIFLMESFLLSKTFQWFCSANLLQKFMVSSPKKNDPSGKLIVREKHVPVKLKKKFRELASRNPIPKIKKD